MRSAFSKTVLMIPAFAKRKEENKPAGPPPAMMTSAAPPPALEAIALGLCCSLGSRLRLMALALNPRLSLIDALLRCRKAEGKSVRNLALSKENGERGSTKSLIGYKNSVLEVWLQLQS